MCPSEDTCLTADQGVASSIPPVQRRLSMLTIIHLSPADSRRVVVIFHMFTPASLYLDIELYVE